MKNLHATDHGQKKKKKIKKGDETKKKKKVRWAVTQESTSKHKLKTPYSLDYLPQHWG